MLGTIYKQEPNSGIDKLLFSVIIFDLIKLCSGIWSKIENKTCFLEDGSSGTHLKSLLAHKLSDKNDHV